MRPILTAADVTEDVIEAAIDAADGWYPEGPIEWDDLIDRLEREIEGADFGESYLSPAIAKIKRAVRRHRQENGL